MDTKNYQDVLSLAESETQKNKVSMILEEAGNHGNAEVPDPYYGTMQDFENVFQMLDEACEIIAEKYDLK
jgi:protein-tyrosine phosphatase